MPSPSSHLQLTRPPYVQKYFGLGNFSGVSSYYKTAVGGGEVGVATGFGGSVIFRVDGLLVKNQIICHRYSGANAWGYYLTINGSFRLSVVMVNGSASTVASTSYQLTAADVGRIFVVHFQHTGSSLQLSVNRQSVSPDVAISGYLSGSGIAKETGALSADANYAATGVTVLSEMYWRGVASDTEMRRLFDYVRAHGDLPSQFWPGGAAGIVITHRWSVAEAHYHSGTDGESANPIPDTITQAPVDQMNKVGDVKLRVFDARRSGQKSYGALGPSASSYLEGASIIRTAASGYWFSLMATPYSIVSSPTYRKLLDFGRSAIYAALGSQLAINAQGGSVNAASGTITSAMLGQPMVITGSMRGSTFEAYINGVSTGAEVAAVENPVASILRLHAEVATTPPSSWGQDWTIHGYAIGRVVGGLNTAEALAHANACLVAGRMVPIVDKTDHYIDITADVRQNGGPANGVPAQVLDRIGTDHLTRVGGLVVDGTGLTNFGAQYIQSYDNASGLLGSAGGFWLEALITPRVSARNQSFFSNTGASPSGLHLWMVANTSVVRAQFGDGATNVNADVSVTANEMAHVAVRYNGTIGEVFLNGTLAFTTASFEYALANQLTKLGVLWNGAAPWLNDKSALFGVGGGHFIPTNGEIATAASAALAAGKLVGILGKTDRRWSIVDDVSDAGGKVPVAVRDRTGNAPALVLVGSALQVAARTERTWSYETSPILHGLSPFDVTSKSVSCAGGTAGDAASLWFALLVIVTSQATVGLQELAGKRSSGFGAGWGVRATANNTQLTAAVFAGGAIKSAPIVSIAATDVGKLLMIGGELDAPAGVVRAYSKRAQVSTGTSLGGSYVAAPSAPCTLGPIVTAVGGAAASTLTGIRILGLMCGQGLPGLARWQAAFDAAQAVEDLVAIPGYTEHLWSVTRAVKSNNGVLSATIPDLIGTDHMPVAGALSAEGVYARSWNW